MIEGSQDEVGLVPEIQRLLPLKLKSQIVGVIQLLLYFC